MIARSSESPDLFNGPYAVRLSGHVGQVIVDADGATVCWTCDGALAGVLAGLLNHVAGVDPVPQPPVEGEAGGDWGYSRSAGSGWLSFSNGSGV
jgi:hypothetical protein